MNKSLLILAMFCVFVTQGYCRLVYQGQVKDSAGGVDGLWGAQCVTLSPDGHHVYAAGSWDDAISWFSRDSLTGGLTYGGLLKNGVDGVDGLNRVRALAVSPDGRYLYATSTNELSVAWFSRNAVTGALTFGGLAKNGQNGVSGLYEPHSVALSHDGKHCYATGAFDNTVVWFTCNPTDGSLAFGGFLKDSVDDVDGLRGAYSVCVSADDKNIYVASLLDHAVSWFNRSAATGSLTYGGVVKSGMVDVKGMRGPTSVAASPDGKSVYCACATSDALVWLTRDRTTGKLTYSGSFQDSVNTLGGGNDTYGMNGAYSVAVSPEGDYIYVAARWSSAVTWFNRDTLTGAPSFGGTIKNVSGLGDAKWVALDPRGAYVYIAATSDNAISWFSVEHSIVVIKPNPKGAAASTFSIHMNNPGLREHGCTIGYSVQAPGGESVYLAITDLHGQIVRTLFRGTEAAGAHSRAWDFRTGAGSFVTNGLYLCILKTGAMNNNVGSIIVAR